MFDSFLKFLRRFKFQHLISSSLVEAIVAECWKSRLQLELGYGGRFACTRGKRDNDNVVKIIWYLASAYSCREGNAVRLSCGRWRFFVFMSERVCANNSHKSYSVC